MVGSCLMIGLEGCSLSSEEKSFIVSNNISGIVLFKRNVQSFKQVYELCVEIKSLITPAPLIAIDMEGGEVNRFSHLKNSFPWPSPKILGHLESHQVFNVACAMGKQLFALGIDINFAPVVDLLYTDNPLLTNRIFGTSKEDILKGADSFIGGLVKKNIIPCLKHFPGHGGVSEDSHKDLPKDSRLFSDLKPQLEIFQLLFKKYSCWIMTAHIEFSCIDSQPATFSEAILKTKLKKQMGFKGLLASDDIDMKALEPFSSGEKFFRALKAGCNLVLTCQKKETAREIIEYFKQKPEKKEGIKKELIVSSKAILAIRKAAAKPLSSFAIIEKELSMEKLGEKLQTWVEELS